MLKLKGSRGFDFFFFFFFALGIFLRAESLCENIAVYVEKSKMNDRKLATCDRTEASNIANTARLSLRGPRTASSPAHGSP